MYDWTFQERMDASENYTVGVMINHVQGFLTAENEAFYTVLLTNFLFSESLLHFWSYRAVPYIHRLCISCQASTQGR